MNLPAGTFNLAAEKYYRTALRKQHIKESFDILREDIIKLDQAVSGVSHEMRSLLHNILQEKNPASFMETAQSEVMREKADAADSGKTCLSYSGIHTLQK
jgi:prophage DNA circulation protein